MFTRTKLRLSSFLLAVLLSSPATGLAQNCIEYGQFFHWVGGWSIPYPGEAVDLVADGDLAFVACYAEGLKILEISDPSHPHVIGEMETPGVVRGVDVVGTIAYVTDSQAGLLTVDISDPAAPWCIGSLDPPGDAWRVTVSGHHAYLCGSSGGIQIVDVQQPASPVVISSLELPGDDAQRIAIWENHAFVAGGDANAVFVVDVTDPSDPDLVGTLDAPGFVSDIAIADGVAYATDYDPGLLIIDILVPEAPRVVGRVEFDLPGLASSVAVSGAVAFVGCGPPWGGFWEVDVAEPDAPQVIRKVDHGDPVSRFAFVDELILLASGGVEIFDAATLEPAPRIGALELTSLSEAVQVMGNHAVVAGSDVHVIDVSDPESPRRVGSLDLLEPRDQLAVTDRYAFLVGGGPGLDVVDVGDPEDPQLVAQLEIPDVLTDIEVRGHHLFCTSVDYHFMVVDVATPESPMLVTTLEETGLNLELSGEHAIVGGVDPLRIIDISDLDAPYVCGQVSLNWGTVAVAADKAFIKTYSELVIVDIADPTSPTILGSMALGGLPRGIVTRDDVVYLANTDGLFVIDVADPRDPRLLGISSHIQAGVDMEIVGDEVYVADGFQGLKIVPAQCAALVGVEGNLDDPSRPATPLVSGLEVYPNPFNPMVTVSFAVEQPSNVQVLVVDLKGKLVCELAAGDYPSGRHSVSWSGLDMRGRAVAAGTYLVRMSAGSRVENRKISLVR